MMNGHFKPQIAEETNREGTMVHRGEVLKTAAADWAGGLKEVVKERVVDTAQKTDKYVRSHPGRFIAGACCLGLAAGWLLGRTMGNKKR